MQLPKDAAYGICRFNDSPSGVIPGSRNRVVRFSRHHRGFHRAGIRPGNAEVTPEGETLPETWSTSTLIAAGRRQTGPLFTLSVLAVATWLACVTLSAFVRPEPEIHRTALVIHLAAMVVSFSGVLAVDIRGFLWMAGIRPVYAALRMESFATPLVWGGLLVLMVSGIFLEPSMGALPTLAKLVAVLGLILNGIWLVPFKERLRAVGRDAPFLAFTPWFQQQLLLRFLASQLCWWTAVMVGFISAASH